MGNNAINLIRSARESALKNRAAAIQKASKPFDDEIAAYDKAMSQLSVTPAKPVKKAPPKKKRASKKKATPKKKVVAKKKAALVKKKAPKKAASKKKKAPAKKAAAKKRGVPAIPGSYPKEGTILEKMSFVINEPKRFLNIHEIANLIKKYEPSQNADDIKPRFSKHINKFRAQGRIVSYHDKATNNVYYGLPEYMKQGKALKGHEHAKQPSAK